MSRRPSQPQTLPNPLDKRWRGILQGLDQLRDEELLRLQTALDDPQNSKLLTDSANYDPAHDRWCALAVAIDLPKRLQGLGLTVRSNTQGREALIEVAQMDHPHFFTNPLSGVRGNAFTTHRRDDLRLAVLGILRLRSVTSRPNGRREWTKADVASVIDCLRDASALFHA
jgi:hypothetical protein